MKNNCLLFLLIGGSLLLLISSNNNVSAAVMRERQQPVTGDAKGGTWQVVGTTGVNAMHIFVSAHNKVILVDKFEANELKQPNGEPAISAEYDLDTNQVRALTLTSDTFCSAGSWLGNGTLVHAGGDNENPAFAPGGQTLRFYDPSSGEWVERVGLLLSKRWYPTMLPLANGKVIIFGGSVSGTGLNQEKLNNPTYNIWPPKNGGDAPDPDVPIQFLVDTLPYNLYVFLHLVPNNENKNILFILANQTPILFDLDNNAVLGTYPKIATQRTYPQTGTSVMLPLYPETNYKPEIMVCGGQQAFEIESPADSSCGRLDLSAKEPTWQMDNFGGIPRVMPDGVILANGLVLFLNGAQTGFAGFRKGNAANPLWVNNNPAFSPVLYDPYTRTYTTMNPSNIARMYHSVASLLPDGSVLVAGSNPQSSVSKNVLFPTEYRAENFKPPYLLTSIPRPTIFRINGNEINQSRIPINYGQSFTVNVQLTTTDVPSFMVSLIHHGFVTHSQHMGQRFVKLVIESALYDSAGPNQYVLQITAPPNPTIIAPGPHFLYVLNNGVPCVMAAEVLLN